MSSFKPVFSQSDPKYTKNIIFNFSCCFTDVKNLCTLLKKEHLNNNENYAAYSDID